MQPRHQSASIAQVLEPQPSGATQLNRGICMQPAATLYQHHQKLPQNNILSLPNRTGGDTVPINDRGWSAVELQTIR